MLVATLKVACRLWIDSRYSSYSDKTTSTIGAMPGHLHLRASCDVSEHDRLHLQQQSLPVNNVSNSRDCFFFSERQMTFTLRKLS